MESSEFVRKLREEMEQAIHQFLEEVNHDRVEHHKSVVQWNAAVKFLMARKFDVKRAIDLFYSHEKTREDEDLVYVDPHDKLLQKEVATEKFTILPGRDYSGAAIALFTAVKHHPPQTTHQIVLKGLVYQLDAALECLEIQRHGLVFVYDMTNSKYANFDYELSIKILNLLKGAYPARLKRVLIVTAPLWFKAPFKILRLFVKEKLRDRVFTVSVSQLTNYIPRESLPRSLGGALVSSHKAWEQFCFKVATKQQPEMETYFIPRKRGRDGEPRSSLSHSMSVDSDRGLSDLESETSKETINEKQNHEDREKEREDQNEKEVALEKDGYIMMGKRRKTSSSEPINVDARKRSSSGSNAHNDQPDSGQQKKKRPPSSGSNILDDSIHMPEQGGTTLEQLLEHVLDVRKRGLLDEYAVIRSEAPAGTFNTARARHNAAKNRYTDVLCFDHSRVKLPQVEGDPSSDYINANFVDGYMQKNAYICTQGPLPKTFPDFWRMVWLNQTRVIVMTTRQVERQRMKCGQYWPLEANTDEQFEEFLVTTLSVDCYHEFTETKVKVENLQTHESRQVTHLQFTSWPDYGVPPASGFLDFLFHVRRVQESATRALADWHGHPLGPPIIVHCSAGIGRTGTFISIDICLRRLEDIGTVDIPQTVRRIRSQRAFSIQMPDQYVFCYLGVLEYAFRQGLLPEKDLSVLDSESDSD